MIAKITKTDNKIKKVGVKIFPILSITLPGFNAKAKTARKNINEKIKIVSENYFEKQTPNAFKNNNLRRFIKENDINEVKIVGCDACNAVSATAKGAVELGLKVSVMRSATATVNEERFIKLSSKLKGFGVAYI